MQPLPNRILPSSHALSLARFVGVNDLTLSIFLVMFVLPQILLLGEKIIDKTSFKVSVPIKLNRSFGVMRVDGFMEGQFNGTIVGEVHAVVRGELSAFIRSGNLVKLEEGDPGFLIEENIPGEIKEVTDQKKNDAGDDEKGGSPGLKGDPVEKGKGADNGGES